VVAGRNREVALTLTPVGGGRFEVYLNGEELYNRKNAPTIEKSVADVRTIVVLAEEIRGKLLAALDAADAAQPAAAAAAH
jgi:predicted Rdx family selenoprotein